jgi:hypothetical protein
VLRHSSSTPSLSRPKGGRILETFTEPKEFVEHARYEDERQEALAALVSASIDEPIVDIVSSFAMLGHCFTLQSCYGHFICRPEQDTYTFESIPRGWDSPVRYRIAYIAFCIQNSDRGKMLRQALARIPEIAPDYVQFGSADWFWDQWLNTYVLQVMPIDDRLKDETILNPLEALRTQEVRGLFFRKLRELLAAEIG